MRVSITGIGVMSPAGSGMAPLWSAAQKGQPLDLQAMSGEMTPVDFAEQSAREALNYSGWKKLDSQDGLILATTVGQAPLWEKRLDSEQAMRAQPLGHLLDSLAERLHFTGKKWLLSSACSASTQAIALATEWIRSGEVKRCLVGGVEVFSQLTIEGFRSLQLLAPEHARPFDKNRQGIRLSEATVFICLEPNAPTSLAEVTGWGMSSDAYHATSPEPTGAGSLTAMRTALNRAGLQPEEISWIHAHGTGSQANDQAEGSAIASLFGGDACFSSTKGLHGHALGASGALETALCVEALSRQTILGTVGFAEEDPKIAAVPQKDSKPRSLKHILKNTLGFGGNNASLVLSSPGLNPKTPPSEKKTGKKTPREVQGLSEAFASVEAVEKLKQNPQYRKATHNMLWALSAAQGALEKADLPQLGIQLNSLILVLGSDHGELETTYDFLKGLESGVARPFLFQNSLHNATTGFLSVQLGIRGPSVTVSTGLGNGKKSEEDAESIAKLMLASSQDPVAAALVVGVEGRVEKLKGVVETEARARARVFVVQ